MPDSPVAAATRRIRNSPCWHLYEAERVGVPVKERTWRLALDYWVRRKTTTARGAISPRRHAGTGSMTCAGIASVYIASGRLSAGDAEVTPQGLKCCGQQLDDPAVAAIEKVLFGSATISPCVMNPGPGSLGTWHLYYLYAVERVGRMTSHRFFNSRDFKRYDWYRMGAEQLVQQQDGLNGYWKGDGHAETMPQISTSFALLFLAKGRRPVLIAKARYGPDRRLGSASRRLAHLTGYVETKWKHDFPLGLSWQIVDLAEASVDDLLQSPVLYISGSQKLPLENQAKKLREYIDRGGFIFAEACCPESSGFDKSFRQLMEQVFDEPEYRLKPLSPDHPLWVAEEPVRPALRPKYVVGRLRLPHERRLRGAGGAGRFAKWTFLLLGSGRRARSRNCPQRCKSKSGAALSMGINVLAYATNRQLKSKDENFQLPDSDTKDQDTFERGKRYVANVRHAGGSDAAPGALPNLMRAATRELKAHFSSEQRQVETDRSRFVQLRRAVHARPQQFSIIG